MNNKPFSCLSVIACVLVLLVACRDPFIETRPDLLDEVPDDAGLVAVHVTNNVKYLNWRLFTWTSINVVDINNTEKRYRLRASGTGMLNSRVFIGALPPGDYRIFNLHSYLDAGDASYWLNAPVSGNLGTFRVEQDHITSLGTVVYQPLGETEIDGKPRRLYVVARVHDQEDLRPFIADVFPDRYQDATEKMMLGWDVDEFGHDRQEMASKVRSFAGGFHHHRLHDGTLAMTGAMGHIFVRHGDAEWQRIDTGFSHRLAAVIAYDGGYVAAGERGLVLQAESLDSDWQPVPGPGTQEAVFWLTALNDGGFMALARADNEVRLYRVAADFSSWDPLLYFEHKPGILYTNADEVHGVVTDNGNILVFGDRRRIELNSNGEIISETESRDMHRLEVQDDNTLVAYESNAVFGSGRLAVSRDWGHTWIRLARAGSRERFPNRLQRIGYVLPENEVWRFSRKGIVDKIRRKVNYEEESRLRRSDADRNVYDWGEKVEPECANLKPGISTPNQLFAACRSGKLLMSRDNGQTWSVDFSPGISDEDTDELMEAPTI